MNPDIIKKIKEKKELSSISDEYVLETLERIILQNPKLAKAIKENRTRSSEYKDAIKKTRAKLRIEYGMFSEELPEREEILKKEQDDDKLLLTHKSTAERINIYPYIYQKIFDITGIPKKILDLGCGMNPASNKYMQLADFEYYAGELSEKDCKFIEKYFRKRKIKGKAFATNLKKPELLEILPEADVCFLFKVLDTVEKKGHKLAEEIINKVNAKWIVASFATHNLGGKRMEHPRRGWIERMLERLEYKFKIIEEENEIFYVIEKL